MLKSLPSGVVLLNGVDVVAAQANLIASISTMQSTLTVQNEQAAIDSNTIALQAKTIAAQALRSKAQDEEFKELNAKVVELATNATTQELQVRELSKTDPSCPSYPTLTNGEAHGYGDTLGSVRVLSCNEGFILALEPKSGSAEPWPPHWMSSEEHEVESTVICRADRTWSDGARSRCVVAATTPTMTPTTTMTSTSPTTTPTTPDSIVIVSDGTRSAPHCTWNMSPCVWDQSVKEKCAKGLCEAVPGREYVDFIDASNDYCRESFISGTAWFYLALTSGAPYQQGSWSSDAQITASCKPPP